MEITNLISKMIGYETGVPHRIAHFLKVYAFAKSIGTQEGIDRETQEILETAAVVHDIGIKPSLEKYNSSAGNYQQIEGVQPARDMLGEMGYDKKVIDRVCYLIAHHHTYTNIDGMDYQILVEADFLVNIFEDNMNVEQIKSIKEKIFKTKTGTDYLVKNFLSDK